VGEESAFVLFQRLAREARLPVWVQGGIGLHTTAACAAGGAAGIVLDGQLALLRESTLPAPVRDIVRAMDGSETRLLGGHRVFTRPDLSLPDIAGDSTLSVLANDGHMVYTGAEMP
jgi:hypothetical protein